MNSSTSLIESNEVVLLPCQTQRDKNILRQKLPMLRPECLCVLEVCTTLLKTCAADGLTLFDIASVMTRPFVDSNEEPSELERMCAYARQCVEVSSTVIQTLSVDVAVVGHAMLSVAGKFVVHVWFHFNQSLF